MQFSKPPPLTFPELDSNIATPETHTAFATICNTLIKKYNDFVNGEYEHHIKTLAIDGMSQPEQVAQAQNSNSKILRERIRLFSIYELHLNTITARSIKNWIDTNLDNEKLDVHLDQHTILEHERMVYFTISTSLSNIPRTNDALQFTVIDLIDPTSMGIISNEFVKLPTEIDSNLNKIGMGFASDIIANFAQSLGLLIEITVDRKVIFSDIIDRLPYNGFPKSCLVSNMMTYSALGVDVYKFDQYGQKQKINDMLYMKVKCIRLSDADSRVLRVGRLYDHTYNLLLQEGTGTVNMHTSSTHFPTYPSSVFANRNTNQDNLTQLWVSRYIHRWSYKKYRYPNRVFSEALASLEKTLIFKTHLKG